jgi:hypothetical protein
MENALKAKPEDIREQCEVPLKELQEACGEAMMELCARKKLQSLPGQQHPFRVIGDWIGFYNTPRPHQVLGMKMLARAFELAAWPVQISLAHHTAAR